MAGYVGNIPVPQGTQTRQTFTATASQTSFPTLGYTAGFIDVYLNGVKLLDTVDYAATNGSDVVLTTGAALNDILEVTIFDTFTTAGTSFTNPTFIDTATISGDTTATVTLKNNTEEDTDGGRESTIIFQGEQSGGEISTLAEIEASHDGTADDEKGDLIFRTNDGSDGASPTEAMRITSSQDVGIGDATPESNANFKALTVSSTSGSGGGQVYVQSSTVSSVFGADNSGSGPKSILQTVTNHPLVLGTNNTERLRVTNDGLTFNGDTAAANALSDYEEGTWTPTTSGTNPTVQNASYTKIGRTVHISIYLNSMSGATGTQINGLPFTPSNLTYSPTRYHSNATNYHQYVLRANSNSTSLTFLDNTDAGVAITTATSSFLVASLTYQTDA